MGTARSYAYDDPNYTIVRQAIFDVSAAASATAYAKFRARAKVVVNSIMIAVASAASLAKVVFTAERDASVNSTVTIASATSAGASTIISCAITLDPFVTGTSAGSMLALKLTDAKGKYNVVYEYQVLPDQSMYAAA